jgi:hypothetical protein
MNIKISLPKEEIPRPVVMTLERKKLLKVVAIIFMA